MLTRSLQLQQQLIRRGLMRIIKAKLAAAVATWRQQAADAKRAAHMAGGAIRRMLNRKRMGGGAIRRMLNRKLSMAWEKWQFDAAEMAYQQQLIRRGLMRIIKAKLAAAVATWRQQAADAKRAAHMAGGAIRRMLNRKLSMAWEKWQFDAEQEAVDGMGEVAVHCC
eukprot:TRINITY_DN513_c0_g1_i10.p1 TRINITY_DN513_c0_g1~~TRINITY_DN513_c0_g1_i10.p1  ORF type:complete len:166 (-),score=62.17 TRINITY_DN513_c0_g1_i10:65-562(-)